MFAFLFQMTFMFFLFQTTFMLNFLEASHYKINGYLCKMEGKSSPSNMFQQYIETVRDKQVMK